MSDEHFWLEDIERELGFSPYSATSEELAVALFKILVRVKVLERSLGAPSLKLGELSKEVRA